MARKPTVYDKRKYRVKCVEDAKKVSLNYLMTIELDKVIVFGLPEVDDRFHLWRVPLKTTDDRKIGEIVVDAFTSLILEKKTTQKEVLEARLLGRSKPESSMTDKADTPKISRLRNTVGYGDSEELLLHTPSESVDLVFTSPPYYNARPEYSDYIQYDEYLLKMRKVIHLCHRVLNEGRFFVLNVSPVLIRRASRSESSKRIAVPFDFHRIFIERGFRVYR